MLGKEAHGTIWLPIVCLRSPRINQIFILSSIHLRSWRQNVRRWGGKGTINIPNFSWKSLWHSNDWQFTILRQGKGYQCIFFFKYYKCQLVDDIPSVMDWKLFVLDNILKFISRFYWHSFLVDVTKYTSHNNTIQLVPFVTEISSLQWIWTLQKANSSIVYLSPYQIILMKNRQGNSAWQVITGLPFTKQTDISPLDLVKPQDRQIPIYTFQSLWNLADTSAAVLSRCVTCQIDSIIITSYLAVPRLHEISRLDVRPLDE